MDIQRELRNQARKLLEEKKVDLIIGYKQGTMPLRTTPCFIKDKAGVEDLIWNQFCENNLVKYLVGRSEKIGVVVKGCDVRSMVSLIKEKQIEKERVTIIGIPCSGVVDRKKVQMDLRGEEVVKVDLEDGKIRIETRDSERSLESQKFLHDSCLVCKYKNPPLWDILIGEKVEESQSENEYGKIEEMAKKTAEERWQYFNAEIEKCIRCYACRNACPLCYCQECFVDQNFPAWFGKTINLSDTLCFHIMRAFHTTGRCVDCGACVRACPMNIDLRMLTKKIEKDVKELFGAEAGLDLEELPPFASYSEDDPQEFIK